MSGHDLYIWATVADIDPRRLKRISYRYARAIFEILVDAHYDSDFNWIMDETPLAIYDPMFTQGSDMRTLMDLHLELRYTRRDLEERTVA